MKIVWITIATGFPVLVLVFLAAYLHSRKLMREAKNYERGLKMVPLKIHLPPLSDDVENEKRDSRDVAEENISKAQVMYSIIASTAQKGMKTNYYGQRHISFEVVATNGFVYFYAAVPVALVSVIKQAIISAYPTAQVEETKEHNLFSEAGKISGVIGGEMSLRKDYVFPIATYQEVKRDFIQSLLSAMATLEKDDGAGVQILIRPARKEWSKRSREEAKKRSKGEVKKSGLGSFAKDVIQAPVKAPDEKSKEPEKPKEISGTDKDIIEAVEAKTQHPGYEVLIRVVVSTNMSQKSQAIYSNLIASFSLFEAQGRNGFQHNEAKDIDSFVTAYIMRFFPPENNKNILNSIELASIFHIPDQSNIPTSQLERQASKQVDGPRNMPEDGLILGYNVFRGTKKKIVLTNEDRMRHVYIVGQTGVGKTVLLENLAIQDMLNGNGFALVDPHGDIAERLLSMIPQERTEDVIYFCPADMDYPMGLNLFDFDSPDEQDFLIQEGINMLYKLYDPQRQGIIGPRYEYMFRNAAKAIMADPQGGTFIDIPKLFNDKEFVNQKMKYVTDNTVRDFWLKEVPQSERSSEFGEVKSWFVSKFSAFLGNDMMRNIIGQTESSINMREIMDSGKILLVNLSKGRTGELNAKLLGMLFVMKFQMAAMARANVPESERRDFTLYVDEFQNFATESFASILSEARKYRLSLVVANQFTTQLSEEVRDAVFGNVGSAISFRLSAQDAENMTRQFYQPVFDIDDMTRLPVGNTVVRMLIGGVPTQPFSLSTLPPLGSGNPELKDALRQLSAAKYGKPRAEVEKMIEERLTVATPTVPGASANGAGMPMPGSSFAGMANSQLGSPSGQPFNPGAANGAANYGAATGSGAQAPRSPQDLGAPVAPGAFGQTLAQPLAPKQNKSFLDSWMQKQGQVASGISAPKPQASSAAPVQPAVDDKASFGSTSSFDPVVTDELDDLSKQAVAGKEQRSEPKSDTNMSEPALIDEPELKFEEVPEVSIPEPEPALEPEPKLDETEGHFGDEGEIKL